MSWYIKQRGPRAEVAAVVDADQNFPAGLKSTVLEMLKPGDVPGEPDSARVETHGHFGGTHPCVTKLELELFNAPAAAPVHAPSGEQPVAPA